MEIPQNHKLFRTTRVDALRPPSMQDLRTYSRWMWRKGASGWWEEVELYFADNDWTPGRSPVAMLCRRSVMYDAMAGGTRHLDSKFRGYPSPIISLDGDWIPVVDGLPKVRDRARANGPEARPRRTQGPCTLQRTCHPHGANPAEDAAGVEDAD